MTKTPPLPASGGSYTRAKNGKLTLKQKPTEEPRVDQPAEPEVTAEETDQ